MANGSMLRRVRAIARRYGARAGDVGAVLSFWTVPKLDADVALS